MSMIIAAPYSIMTLNEAEITHGRSINYENFDILPHHVQQTMVDMMCKEYNMSEEQAYAMARARTTGAAEDHKISLGGKDPFEGIYMHMLEKYDKAQDEAILASNNIVEAYNSMINGHIQKAFDYAKKYIEALTHNGEPDINQVKSVITAASKDGVHTIIEYMANLIAIQKDLNMSDNEIKKVIAEAAYQPSDDPEEIKRIVNGRIQYNNIIIGLFKKMLNINYSILGMTKDEALMLSEKLDSEKHEDRADAIKAVKTAVMNNPKEFKHGNTWDFRKVGGGCMFITGEDIGDLSSFVSIDRMLQMVMTYDAIVVGHGGSTNKKAEAVIQRRRDDFQKRVDKMRRDVNTKRDEIEKYTEELQAKLDKMRDVDNATHEHFRKRIKKIDSDSRRRSADFDKRVNELNKKRHAALDSYNIELYEKYSKLIDIAYESEMKTSNEYVARIKKVSDNLLTDKRWYEDGSEYDKVHIAGHDRLRKMRKEYDEEYDKVTKEIDELYEHSSEEFMKEYRRIKYKYDNESTWTIQPVKTLHGGPFTDVNDLVRQLIKEGFKNIYLISCNPGHHQLAKDIRDTKGVKITHAENTLLAENTTSIFNEWYEVEQNLYLAESHLMQICNESGILYGNDDYLNECTEFFMSNQHIDIIVEGVLSNAWAKVKVLVKKALGFIINIFKKLIDLFKKIIQKIKDFFKKIFGSNKLKNNFTKNVTSSAIMVESARVDKYSASSWEQMQKEVIRACESISKKITEHENKQTKNMQELERFAEKQARTVNESADPMLDQICTFIW